MVFKSPKDKKQTPKTTTNKNQDLVTPHHPLKCMQSSENFISSNSNANSNWITGGWGVAKEK